MDKLTAESAAVRMYAAWAGISVNKALGIFSIPREMRDSFDCVAAEHERICAERIATAEREARVRGLREALAALNENIQWQNCYELHTGYLRESIQELIAAAETPSPAVDAQPSAKEPDHG